MLLFKHVSRPRQLVSLVQLWEKSGTEFALHQVWILFSFYLASPSKHTKMWIVPPNQKGSFWMLQARSPLRQVFFSRVKFQSTFLLVDCESREAAGDCWCTAPVQQQKHKICRPLFFSFYQNVPLQYCSTCHIPFLPIATMAFVFCYHQIQSDPA